MACNDLRARGGAWGGGREVPHQLGVGVARSSTPTASSKYNVSFLESSASLIEVKAAMIVNLDLELAKRASSSFGINFILRRQLEYRFIS